MLCMTMYCTNTSTELFSSRGSGIPLLYLKDGVMRFVIPVVFYEITNLHSVYWSNTTIFIGRI